MNFTVELGEPKEKWWTVKVGNAYQAGLNVKGSDLRLRVLIAITDGVCFFLTIRSKNGAIVGFSKAPLAQIDKLAPIGVVPGLSDLEYDVTPFQNGSI